MPVWRFLNTGLRDGATNMALDEALLIGAGRGASPPTVRVFGWSPPTVSLGHSQDPAAELDLAACDRAGVGVVRRPTGGRAVFHAGELTYSVVGPSGTPPLGRSIRETYRVIGEAIVAGLSLLGVRASLEETGTDPGLRRGGASPPCFVSSGRYEVVLGRRKLVGSAQRRAGRAVLQHGSVLMDMRHADLAELLASLTGEERAAVRRSLVERTTTLESAVGRPVGFDAVADAMRRGFEAAWGVKLAEGSLTSAEQSLASELARRYAIRR
ncbi:MAG: lipoate--protein ligase family protein [Candidatus Eisenbacteria bacterium]|nr:lipoate--protein ligase family protein [Candidatus Eisenbacteria bacterium]